MTAGLEQQCSDPNPHDPHGYCPGRTFPAEELFKGFTATAHIVMLAPVRGGDTEQWLMTWLGKFKKPQRYWGEEDDIWNIINEMLEDYRRHADAETRLIFDIPEEPIIKDSQE